MKAVFDRIAKKQENRLYIVHKKQEVDQKPLTLSVGNSILRVDLIKNRIQINNMGTFPKLF